eukprot:scaffold3950_cov100-Skeletonema_dohrnii-CCMP3373.AAC.7
MKAATIIVWICIFGFGGGWFGPVPPSRLLSGFESRTSPTGCPMSWTELILEKVIAAAHRLFSSSASTTTRSLGDLKRSNLGWRQHHIDWTTLS